MWAFLIGMLSGIALSVIVVVIITVILIYMSDEVLDKIWNVFVR